MASARRRVVWFMVAVAALLSAAIPTLALAAGGPPRLLNFDFTRHFAVRPETMYFGVDGGVFVTGPNVSRADFKARRDGHIDWVRWNGRRAKGLATVWIETCVPDCATGGSIPYPGSLRASRVRDGHYTRLLLSYQKGGRTVSHRYVLSFVGGTYGWQ